jgi:hypothetical protein
MLDKLPHHKLLTDGLEGEGVVTERKCEMSNGLDEHFRLEGHIKFDDGTEAKFAAGGLNTAKVGHLEFLNVGTIVPVRYDASRTHAVLDIPKLEAKQAARKKAAAEWRERRKAEEIAAADAALAKGNKDGRHDR